MPIKRLVRDYGLGSIYAVSTSHDKGSSNRLEIPHGTLVVKNL